MERIERARSGSAGMAAAGGGRCSQVRVVVNGASAQDEPLPLGKSASEATCNSSPLAMEPKNAGDLTTLLPIIILLT